MKKLIFMFALVLLVVNSFGADPTAWQRSTFQNGYQWSGNLSRDFATQWAKSVESQTPRVGDVWYVDGNMSDNNGDGKSWKTAFQLLSTALAASHADIAVSADREWASRNTIWVRADGITEDLTALAQKTDVRGVGSDDAFEKALLTGTITIADTTQYIGCHFYGFIFQDDGAGGVLHDIDTQSGLEYHNCWFRANATDTIGLQVEECQNIVVNNCEFSDQGTNGGFSASAIKVVNDTDAVWNYRITNNYIRSAGIGLDWDETVSEGCIVANNIFDTTGRWIDDEGDDILVIQNMAITAVDTGTWTAGFDLNLAKAAGNIQTGSGGETDEVPVRLQTGN